VRRYALRGAWAWAAMAATACIMALDGYLLVDMVA
jgi:manganese transport protein